MELVNNEEQELLRETVRKFMAEQSPEDEVRRLMETPEGYDPAVWSRMANELGLHGLAVPEDLGGSGFGFVELGIVLEEMGAALLCAPFFASVVLAANTLLEADDPEAAKQYLPQLVSGELIGTLAVAEDGGHWHGGVATTTARRDGDGWLLTGVKSFVLDGLVADVVLVSASSPDGLSVFAVDAHDRGVTTAALPTLDLTRKLARITFEDAPGRLIGVAGSGAGTIASVLDLAAAALAVEQVGGAQRVLDMSVAYAKERVQFGRPIGSFQAIKHKCADMLLQVESARSGAYYALAAADELREDLPIAASLAKAYCSDAYFAVAAENIQIHGGIGFTWEHPAHLYFKRAKSSQLLFGDPSFHRARLADELRLSAAKETLA